MVGDRLAVIVYGLIVSLTVNQPADYNASAMLTKYVKAALARAEYEKLPDGTIYGRIPGCRGVWANAKTLGACKRELQEVLEGWIIVGLRLGHRLPIISGINLNPPRRAARRRLAA